MSNFYKLFVQLCLEKNVTPTRAAIDIGLSNATANGWKKGKIPSDVSIEKLANYFGVTSEYLRGEGKKEDHTADEGSEAVRKAKQDVNTFMEGATEEELSELRNMIGYIKSKRG